MDSNVLMMRGAAGASVQALKTALAAELAGDALMFPGLPCPPGASPESAEFNADTEAALRRWQGGRGLIADGIAGPHCCTLLGLRAEVALEIDPDLPSVRALFPQTKPSNIARFLPYVTDALQAAGLTDRAMVLAALGTIRAETAGFIPIAEYPSRSNTLPGQPVFSAYEPGTLAGDALGNTEQGDGAKYRGRGFVQLTGSDNYHRYTIETGIDIASQPDLANSPEVAAVLLALFLAHHADDMRSALAAGNYLAARKLVNGGSHGLQDFKSVFLLAGQLWPAAGEAPVARSAAMRSLLASTKLPSRARRPRVTLKDPPDLRDRQYQPPAVTLPDVFPDPKDVQAKLSDYRGLVLDQGNDSSCTGYGLACVINFSRWQKGGFGKPLQSVSARMLYTYARRYDEYAGESYEGSSCRGALKGWFNHGVCLWEDWPDNRSDEGTSTGKVLPGSGRPRYGYAERATRNTLGVYYRIDTKSITDMQAAITQAHAIYVSAFTHAGWDAQEYGAPSKAVPSHDNLPLIAWDGRASKGGGHAFALVGFNERGFIVQNSWGPKFGIGGFAVLGYGDWLANGMDAWVAMLGVPGVVGGRIADGAVAQSAALAGDGPWQAKWWDQGTAYEHSVVMGNDGRVTRYLTQDELSRSLQYQCCTLPDQWFRTDPVAAAQETKRLVIYAHGGLNSEADAIARARAMGRYFTGNGCYPLFLVWKTGLLESIQDIVENAFRAPSQRVGLGMDTLFDATDALIEKTIGRGPARGIWSEMKENAQFACNTSRGCDYLAAALQSLVSTWGNKLEIHIVGHSAGSIILGWLLELLSTREYNAPDGASRKLAGNIASAHLYAPACTVQFANRHWAPHDTVMQRLFMHILADNRERDDNVAAIYRKSLLYLVSDALEPDERTPVLGLENVLKPTYTGWDGSSTTTEALANWRAAMQAAQLDQRFEVLQDAHVRVTTAPGAPTIPASHGSFDNNIDIVSQTLRRITGKAQLALPVDDLRGF